MFYWVLDDFCLQIRCFVDVKTMLFHVFLSNNCIQIMTFILNSEPSKTQKCFDWSSHRHGIIKSQFSYILENGSPKVMVAFCKFYLPKSLKIVSFSRLLELFFLAKTLGHTQIIQFWNIEICLKNHHFVLQNTSYFDTHDLSCNGVIMFSKVSKLTICLYIWLWITKKWEF